MSDYRFQKRVPVSLDVEYSEISQDQIDAIYQELLSAAKDDASVLLQVLKSLGDYDLLDLLREELREVPDSPLMEELTRKMKAKLRKDARVIANSIIRSD